MKGSQTERIRDLYTIDLLAAKANVVRSIYDIVGSPFIKALWIFDSVGTEQTVKDRSVNGHTITLRNTSLAAINASNFMPNVQGLLPYLTTNMFSSFLLWDTPDSDDFSCPLSPFSVLWFGKINYLSGAAPDYLISKGGVTSSVVGHEWFLYVDNNYALNGAIYQLDGAAYIGRIHNYRLTADYGSFNTYCMTYNGGILSSGIKLYRNGIRSDGSNLNYGTFAGGTNGPQKVKNYMITDSTPSFMTSTSPSVIVICSCELTQSQIMLLEYLLKGNTGVSL